MAEVEKAMKSVAEIAWVIGCGRPRAPCQLGGPQTPPILQERGPGRGVANQSRAHMVGPSVTNRNRDW